MNKIYRILIGVIVILIIIGVGIYAYMNAKLKDANTLRQAEAEQLTVNFDSNNFDQVIVKSQTISASAVGDEKIPSLIQLANAYAQKAGFSTSSQSEYAQKAIDAANQVLTINPQVAEAYRVRGYAEEILNMYGEAEKNYSKAIEIAPTFALAHANRGHLYELSGDRQKAFADYNKAISLEPDNELATFNLGRYYFTEGDLDQSSIFAKRVIRLSEKNIRLKSSAYELLGNIELASDKGSTTVAIDDFGKAVAIDPSYAGPYLYRAFASIIATQNEKVTPKLNPSILSDIEKGISLNPIEAKAYFYMGLYYYATDKKMAKESFEKALALIDQDVTLVGDDKGNLRGDIQDQLASIKK